MKKLLCFIVILISVVFVNSCDIYNTTSISSELDMRESSTIVSDSVSKDILEASEVTSHDDDFQNIDLTNDTNTFIWRDTGITGCADLPYYSEYGEIKYVLSQNDTGIFGTYALKDSKKTSFYPNAYNVYYYNGVTYGIIVSENDERYYSILHDDGSHEKVFKCENVYYFEDKIYYYGIKQSDEHEDYFTCLYRASIDGSDIEVVADDIYAWPVYPNVIKYSDYIVYTEFNGGINVVSPNGEKALLVEDATSMRSLHIINDDYVYYSECAYSYGFSGSLNATYTLWRVRLDGTNRERLLSHESKSFGFDVAIYNEKLLIFTSNDIHIYDSNLVESNVYDFAEYGIDELEQIIIKNGNVIFSMRNYDEERQEYVVYNSNGEIVFEY